MKMRAHIPNIFTLANLICGSIAAVYVSQSNFATTAIFLIFLAAIFDLLDGAVARALHVSGELGKQLDSLADVISFGLVPTIVVYQMLEISLPASMNYLKFLAFLNVACAALRLAKFNISTDQTHDFSGMPSPANGLFWASILAMYAWPDYSGVAGFEKYPMLPLSFILTMLFVTSLLMVSTIRMFSFKLKPGGFRSNVIPYIFILLIVIVAILSTALWNNILIAVPLSILIYMLLSVVYHFVIKMND